MQQIAAKEIYKARQTIQADLSVKAALSSLFLFSSFPCTLHKPHSTNYLYKLYADIYTLFN